MVYELSHSRFSFSYFFVGAYVFYTIAGIFPSLDRESDGVVGVIAFLLLISIIISFIVFEIQQARHPEKFVPPADSGKFQRQAERLGIFAFVRAIFDNDKILLGKNEKQKISPVKSSSTSFARLMAGFFIACIFTVGFILWANIFLFDLKKNDPVKYREISSTVETIYNNPVSRFVTRMFDAAARR